MSGNTRLYKFENFFYESFKKKQALSCSYIVQDVIELNSCWGLHTFLLLLAFLPLLAFLLLLSFLLFFRSAVLLLASSTCWYWSPCFSCCVHVHFCTNNFFSIVIPIIGLANSKKTVELSDIGFMPQSIGVSDIGHTKKLSIAQLCCYIRKCKLASCMA